MPFKSKNQRAEYMSQYREMQKPVIQSEKVVRIPTALIVTPSDFPNRGVAGNIARAHACFCVV